MSRELLSAEVRLRAEFYDVDSLRVVWHGHYLKYMEKARCALMESIGFSYPEMAAAGYAWPIVSLRVKYCRPLVYRQEFVIRASLIEYENRIRISYLVLDPETKAVINRAETVQMAYDLSSGRGLLVSPACLVEAVQAALRKEKGTTLRLRSGQAPDKDGNG
ncbi:MAG: acyl-CoA thioesterase [Spirochaetales bacterium]|nr:acyl-CoA thioesterase [Spirochaetales bacterium]